MAARPPLGSRFWRIWTATGVSALGTGATRVAFPLLALSFTHRAPLIAGVAVAAGLPAFLVALPVGVLTDRANRRRLLVAIEVLRLAVLGGFGALVIAGAASLGAIYVTVFLAAALEVAFDIGVGTSLPAVVPPDGLVSANTHLLTVELTGDEMVGQAVGGAALAAASALPFVADAASYGFSAWLLGRAIPPNPPATSSTSMLRQLGGGVRYYFSAPLLRTMTGLIGSLAFCQGVVLGVLVLYGTQVLHLSRPGYALLLGVAATGNLVGAFAASRIHRRIGSGWCIVIAGATAACAYPVLGLTTAVIAAGAALALESVGVMLGNIASNALRQRVVPAEFLGRAASVHRLVVLGALPLGNLVGGLVADQIGLRHTFLGAGGLQLVAVAFGAPRLLGALRGHRAAAS